MNKLVKGLLALVGLALGGGLLHKWSNREPEKYSREWIESLTDSQWEVEREIVRKNSINGRLPLSEVIRWENIRNLFDKIKSERDWGDETPRGPRYHREHGFNLYKDD